MDTNSSNGYDYLMHIGALKVFDDFSYSNCKNFAIEHDIPNNQYLTLKEKYNIEEIAGTGDDFSKAVNLLRWVHNNILHNGGATDVEFVPKNSLSILNYSFGKGVEFGVYCRLQAIVFTECCLSLGLAARTIHCLPFSPNDFESHVVSMVYINELKKWVLFDSSNNAYFMNKEGVPLSPLEARESLGNDDVAVSSDLWPSSNTDINSKIKNYKNYMAKNLFYMKFSKFNTFGTDLVRDQITYHLIPRGFDVQTREIAYCEYAIRNSPEHLKSGWTEHLEELKNQKINAVSKEEFLRTE
jgi:hypothetical protein